MSGKTRYTFVLKNGKKRVGAHDHWGQPIIYETEEEAKAALEGFSSLSDDLQVVETRSRVKAVGMLGNLNWT